MAVSQYVEMIRRHTLPDAGDSEAFAKRVVDDHSWYKDLPVHPRVPFVFYLSPPRPGAGAVNWMYETQRTPRGSRYDMWWRKMPDQLKDAGTAWVSSFMRPFPEGIERRRQTGQSLRDWFARPLFHALREQYRPLAELTEVDLQQLPHESAAALRPLLRFWRDGNTPGLTEQELTAKVFDMMASEQQAQIRGMCEAMSRFTAALEEWRDDEPS